MAVVFQVVMYGCESWTMKKAEHRRIDAFEEASSKDGEALYSQQKQDREMTVAQIMTSLLQNSELN